MEDFGTKLLILLKEKGWTYEDLARKAFISKTEISLYIRKGVLPRADYLAFICKALDVSADYLLGLRDER